MGNCGMITGAFSSSSGKADTVLTTSGDVLYYTSSRQRLAIGDEGQVLTVSDSDLPAWETASGGTLVQLDTVTLGSAAANITITPDSAYVAANYSYWIIKAAMGTEDGGENVQFRVNNQSASNYQTNMILNTAGTLSATTENAQSSALIVTADVAQDANDTFQFVMTIELSPQNATNTMRFNWSITDAWDQAGAGPSDTEQSCGLFNNNSQTELNKIDFFLSGGSNFTAGSNLRLYGVTKT